MATLNTKGLSPFCRSSFRVTADGDDTEQVRGHGLQPQPLRRIPTAASRKLTRAGAAAGRVTGESLWRIPTAAVS